MPENSYNKETMMNYLEMQRKSVIHNQSGKWCTFIDLFFFSLYSINTKTYDRFVLIWFHLN